MGADRGTRGLSNACWFDIQHDKSTRVRDDYWREGNLNVLSALVRHSVTFPDDFFPNLLTVHMCVAPAYVRAGVDQVTDLLKACTEKRHGGEHAAGWNLRNGLTLASGNPVFTAINLISIG